MRILPLLTARPGLAALAALMFATVLAGCTPPNQQARMVFGKPFVVLHNVDPGCVRERLLVRLAERGWNVKNLGPASLVAEKAAPAFINTAARQAGYAQPLVRINVFGVLVGPHVEIIVDPFVVTNPGTPSEKLEPIEPTAEVQQSIDDAGRDLEGQCGRR